MVAVKVMLCPRLAGFGFADRDVVVGKVRVWITDWENTGEEAFPRFPA